MGGCRLMRNDVIAILRGGFLWLAAALVANFPQDIVAESKPMSDPIFLEAAQEVGLVFKHFIGATGEFFFPENMGSGVALFDYDGDGDLDVYFLQGTILDETKGPGDSVFQPPFELPPRNQLFRNKLVETGKLTFEDVTDSSGVGHQGFGMGVAVGDYDDDGHLDLYVTNFGPNVLYRNNGDGTFSDVTQEAKADDPRWSMSAAFLDHDRDGDADLFITNYVDFTVKGNRECRNPLGIRDYCAPSVFEPVPDRFFQNEGNGRFRDATEEARFGKALGRGLGVMVADFNNDGWSDLSVANDGSANHLWRNKGDGTFVEEGLLSGTAYNSDGAAEAGMGITAADFDGDGDEDIFVTNNRRETNTLYLNVDGSNFYDATVQFGLSSPSFPNTGFGTLWFDYDNDGALDLFVANGAVGILESRQDDAYPYAQPNQLYRNNGKGHFRDVSVSAGESLELLDVSRGSAFGDLDNDGDVDIVVANNNGPARLLLNQIGSRQHWLGIRLQGKRGVHIGTDGARIAVTRDGHPTLWRRAHRDGSYLSANDSRVDFGLGQDPRLKRVTVYWPAGGCETWEDARPDRVAVLREGSGRACRPE